MWQKFAWDIKAWNGKRVHLILCLDLGFNIPFLSNQNRLMTYVTNIYLGCQSVKWQASTSHSGPGSWRHNSFLIQSEQADWITWLKFTWDIKAWNGERVHIIQGLAPGDTVTFLPNQNRLIWITWQKFTRDVKPWNGKRVCLILGPALGSTALFLSYPIRTD